MLWVTPDFNTWFAAVARAVTAPAGITFVCGVIVVWALWAYWFGFKRRIRPLVTQLKDACRVIERSSDEAEFAAAFHEIHEAIDNNALLKEAWREFNETLLFPAPGKEPIIRNVQTPSYSFRHDALPLENDASNSSVPRKDLDGRKDLTDEASPTTALLCARQSLPLGADVPETIMAVDTLIFTRGHFFF